MTSLYQATNGSKKRKSSSANSDADAGSQPPAAKKAQLAAAAASKNDVSSIHLDGEATQSVPVYDTCDDMRTKINRYMRETVGASNAGLVKLINAAAYPDTNEASAHQLKTFLTGKRGPTRGAESKVFYGAYVFFEKLRVKQDKKKSKKREEMEDVWGSKGMRLQDTSRHGILALPGEKPTEDQFGRLHFMRSGR